MIRTFREYSSRAAETRGDPSNVCPPLIFWALALNGEAGELAEKVKKVYRDRGGVIDPEQRALICKEAGDVLWYLDAICEAAGLSLDAAASANIAKLRSRQERGVIHGNGDNR